MTFTSHEVAQLRRLVDQAFDLRETGYVHDACEAVADWYWRSLPDRLDRKEDQ